MKSTKTGIKGQGFWKKCYFYTCVFQERYSKRVGIKLIAKNLLKCIYQTFVGCVYVDLLQICIIK